MCIWQICYLKGLKNQWLEYHRYYIIPFSVSEQNISIRHLISTYIYSLELESNN